MKLIGLTGGIGSGKTTVLKMFQRLGASVYVADIEAKKLMHSSTTVKEKITNFFGEKSYINGTLNRAFIADIVFKEPKKLQKLNAIVHPAVHQHFQEFVQQQNSPYIIYESALLFENNSQHMFDVVLLITAPEKLRIQRVLEREEITKEQIKSRIQNQLSDQEKIPLADCVIENTNLSEMEKQVKELHRKWLQNK